MYSVSVHHVSVNHLYHDFVPDPDKFGIEMSQIQLHFAPHWFNIVKNRDLIFSKCTLWYSCNINKTKTDQLKHFLSANMCNCITCICIFHSYILLVFYFLITVNTITININKKIKKGILSHLFLQNAGT